MINFQVSCDKMDLLPSQSGNYALYITSLHLGFHGSESWEWLALCADFILFGCPYKGITWRLQMSWTWHPLIFDLCIWSLRKQAAWEVVSKKPGGHMASSPLQGTRQWGCSALPKGTCAAASDFEPRIPWLRAHSPIHWAITGPLNDYFIWMRYFLYIVGWEPEGH